MALLVTTALARKLFSVEPVCVERRILAHNTPAGGRLRSPRGADWCRLVLQPDAEDCITQPDFKDGQYVCVTTCLQGAGTGAVQQSFALGAAAVKRGRAVNCRGQPKAASGFGGKTLHQPTLVQRQRRQPSGSANQTGAGPKCCQCLKILVLFGEAVEGCGPGADAAVHEVRVVANERPSVTLATLNAADGTTQTRTSHCVAGWAKPPNFIRNSTGSL